MLPCCAKNLGQSRRPFWVPAICFGTEAQYSNTAPELTLCRNPQHISKDLRHFYHYLLVFTYNDTYAKALPYSVSDPRVKNSVSACQTVTLTNFPQNGPLLNLISWCFTLLVYQDLKQNIFCLLHHYAKIAELWICKNGNYLPAPSLEARRIIRHFE